jgi:CubicO group peptidase (beta-lactamase class C family)
MSFDNLVYFVPGRGIVSFIIHVMKVVLSVILTLSISLTVHSQASAGDKIDKLLKGYTETGKFNGSALVATHDKILLEKGYGFRNFRDSTLNDSSTVFQIASVTKQFTSTVILKLVELKKLALTDKLSKFYPDFPKGESITIENLLTHTSGIFDWTNSINFSPKNEETLVGFLKTKALDFSPGTSWRYSNSNYSLLGYIIQKVSGMSYENAVRKYIFIPLQMRHSGFDFKNLSVKEKATGYSTFTDTSKIEGPVYDSVGPYAAGEIYSTVGDLYKWHKGLQSYKIINRASLERAYTPVKSHYGYGWIIDSLFNKRITSHSGSIAGFSSNLARIAEDSVFVVLLNNKEGSGLETITNNIFAILYRQPYGIPVKRHPIKLSEDILRKYIGNYEVFSPQGSLQEEVRIENGKLTLHVHGKPKLELLAEKENYFFDLTEDNEECVEFVIGTNGKVDKIVLFQNGISLTGKKII